MTAAVYSGYSHTRFVEMTLVSNGALLYSPDHLKKDERRGSARFPAEGVVVLRNLTRHTAPQVPEVLNLSSGGMLLELEGMVAELGDAVEFQAGAMTFLGEVVHCESTENSRFVGVKFRHGLNENDLRENLSAYLGTDLPHIPR